MVISEALLDELAEKAKASPRLRINLDLRDTPNDQCQRMLNAIEPGSIFPIHRHRETSESVVVLRGKVCWFFYNDKGEILNKFVIEHKGFNCGISVPQGQWHSLECIESAVVFVTKNGIYEPLGEEDIINR